MPTDSLVPKPDRNPTSSRCYPQRSTHKSVDQWRPFIVPRASNTKKRGYVGTIFPDLLSKSRKPDIDKC